MLIIGTPRRHETTQHNDSDSKPSTDDVTSNISNKTVLEQLMELSDDDVLEPWPDFIRRATQIADEHLEKANVQDWAAAYLRKQWQWARRIAQQSPDRWSRCVVQWNPQIDNPERACRPQAHPHKRWDDDINMYLRAQHNNNGEQPPQHWLNAAQHPEWKEMESDYVQYTMNAIFTRRHPATTHDHQTQPQTTTTTTTTTTNMTCLGKQKHH